MNISVNTLPTNYLNGTKTEPKLSKGTTKTLTTLKDKTQTGPVQSNLYAP